MLEDDKMKSASAPETSEVKVEPQKNLRVKVFRSFSEMEAIADAWRAWQFHPNSDLDFYKTIHSLRPEIQRPHALAVYLDDVLDAILIGRIEKAHVGESFGYAQVLNPKAKRLTLIHAGFLGNTSEANSRALLAEILATLKNGEADLAVLSHIPTDAPLFHLASKTPGFLTRDHRIRLQPHRSMEIPASVDELYQRFSAKVRKNLKWQNKKLLTDFENQVRIETFREKTTLDKMFADIEIVAQKTYQRGLGVGFMDSPEMRTRMNLSSEKGWLRAHVLYIREKPCAFWVGTQYQGVFHSDFMGFDREYSKYSPGMFLVLKVIEGLCQPDLARTVSEINFGLGDAQYKEILSTRDWVEGYVTIFAPSLKGLRLNLLVTPPALISDWAKAFLTKSGFLQRVKSKWRRKIAPKNKPSNKDLPDE
jgi:hypothetical protein